MDILTADPFRVAGAALPLGLYLLYLGWLNVRRTPSLVSGTIDTASLGFGLCGVVLVGPFELLAPEEAFLVYSVYAWPMLLVMYSLIVLLIVLLQPPSLILYNVSLEQSQEVLNAAVEKMDSNVQWTGNTLVWPAMGVELTVESFTALRNTKLTGSNVYQNFEGWFRLAQTLQSQLAKVSTGPSAIGIAMLVAGAMLCVASCWVLVMAMQATPEPTTSWLG